MTRPLRLDVPNSWYHLGSKAVRGLTLFGQDQDRHVFLKYLAELGKNHGLETNSYCLMGNHYHLLVRSSEGELAKGMQDLGSRYARYFNKQYGFTGAVFEKRYFSDLITTDSQLLQVSSYIHLNPVKAGLVESPGDCQWSSYRSFLGSAYKPRWLHSDLILRLAGGPTRYQELVEGLEPGTGQIKQRGNSFPTDPGHTQMVRLVAQTVGVDVIDIKSPHRGKRGTARSVALLLDSTNPMLSTGDLRTMYGFESDNSVRRATQRARAKAQTDGPFQEVLLSVASLCPGVRVEDITGSS